MGKIIQGHHTGFHLLLGDQTASILYYQDVDSLIIGEPGSVSMEVGGVYVVLDRRYASMGMGPSKLNNGFKGICHVVGALFAYKKL